MNLPNMLLVGSTARNTGKTTFCTEFIRKWHGLHSIIGVKITTIHAENAPCPHGDEGCGVCAAFKGGYEIIEEKDPFGTKDTCALLGAGALKVYWVRSASLHLSEVVNRLLADLPRDVIIICESNSLSGLVTPGVTIVTQRSGVYDIKPSAKPMLNRADFIVDISDQESLDTAIKKIEISSSNGEIRLTCPILSTTKFIL